MTTMSWDVIRQNIHQQQHKTHRRIEFIPQKKQLSVENAHQKQTNNHSNSTVSEVKENDSSKKDVVDRNDFGLFDPKITIKYVKWKQLIGIGPGFYNHGNTCFLNSTLQCLLHTPMLTQLFRYEPNQIIKGLINSRRGGDKLVVEIFHNLVEDTWTCNRQKPFSPRNMVSCISKVGRQFHHFRQEDAHEYLRQLLDCMHEEILKVNHIKMNAGKIAETSFISRIFGGYLCNTLICTKCSYHSNTYNHFQDLSLEIPSGVNSVVQALKVFMTSENLTRGNEWKCDRCHQKVQAKKQMTLSTPPNVLVIHLKRFLFGNMFKKITKRIHFEPFLDVPVVTQSSVSSDQRSTRTVVKYELYALIVHYGFSAHSGHYIAYVKASNGQWYEMNDSFVSLVSFRKVQDSEAYVLFYTQCKPDPVDGSNSFGESSGSNLVSVNMHRQNGLIPKPSSQLTSSSLPDQLKMSNGSQSEEIGELVARPSIESIAEGLNRDGHDALPPETKVTDGSQTNTIAANNSLSSMIIESATHDPSTSSDGVQGEVSELGKRSRVRKRSVYYIFRFHGLSDRLYKLNTTDPFFGRKMKKIQSLRVEKSKKETFSNNLDSNSIHTIDTEIRNLNRRVEANPVGSMNSVGSRDPIEDQHDVLNRLMMLSNRVRGNNEGVWETTRPEDANMAKQIIAEQIRSEQKFKNSKRVDVWNEMLDEGRRKRMKTQKNDASIQQINQSKSNPFQEYLNSRKNGHDIQ